MGAAFSRSSLPVRRVQPESARTSRAANFRCARSGGSTSRGGGGDLRGVDKQVSGLPQVAVTLALEYAEAKTIHLVMDNLNIHRCKALSDVLGAEMATEVWNCFTVDYTPPMEVGSTRRKSKS